MSDFTWLGLIAAPVGALGGVWLGSRLSTQSDTERWLREQRLETYVHLLNLLTAINRHFAVGMKVSKFEAAEAEEHEHDFEGVADIWQTRLTELEHLELTLSLLGDKVSVQYHQSVDPLILEYFEAVDKENASVTEAQWLGIVDRGTIAIDKITKAARAELGVPASRS